MKIDLSNLYTTTSKGKLADLPAYEARVRQLVPAWRMSILTGQALDMLCVRVASRLIYDSPAKSTTRDERLSNRRTLPDVSGRSGNRHWGGAVL